MNTRENGADIVEKTASLLERAAETKVFLHLLCLLLHLDLCVSISTPKHLISLMWSDIEAFAPGVFVGAIATYCLLMGLVFRLTHALFVFLVIRLLPWQLFPKTPSTLENNVISIWQAREYAHKTKDYEILRMFDERRAAFSRRRTDISNLAELSFAAILLLFADRCLTSHGLLAQAETLFRALLPGDLTYLLALGCALFLASVIWWNISDSLSSEEYYMCYPPLFEEYEALRNEAREKQNKLMRRVDFQRLGSQSEDLD